MPTPTLDHDSIRGDYLTDLDALASGLIATGKSNDEAAYEVAYWLGCMYALPKEACMGAAVLVVKESYVDREHLHEPSHSANQADDALSMCCHGHTGA